MVKTEDQLIKIFEKGPIVLDNFLDKEIEDTLLQLVIENAEFIIGSTYHGTEGEHSQELISKYNINTIYEQIQLCHVSKISDSNNSVPSNFLYPYFIHPLMKACMKLGFKVGEENITRVKTNLQTRAPESSRGKYNTPHTDYMNIFNTSMISAIYYLDDSDGDTYFFNGDVYKMNRGLLKNEIITEERASFLKNLKILSKVSPKKGRMVLFPCVWLHAGSHPVDHTTRIVTNYNFSVDVVKK